MPAAPVLPSYAPADKLQALGPCLGSDSGWGVEATLEASLAASRGQVRVSIVNQPDCSSWVLGQEEALLSSPSCP